MEIHSAAPGSDRIHVAEVPTFEEGQLADPISWSYQKGREMWEEPLRTGPVTFLGVSASPPPRELAAHLPIPRDTGLVVEGIVPDSPAAKAGLEQNDVLTKLDDQILIHPRQLSVLVANRKEGDSVKLSFIRKGEVKEASVVLAMRENKGPSGPSQDMIFKHKDVVIAGDSDAPLRTFVRRFNLPPEAALKQAEAELSVARAKVESALAEGSEGIAGIAYKEAQAAEQDSQKAEIDEIRRKLDEVLKRLEERK